MTIVREPNVMMKCNAAAFLNVFQIKKLKSFFIYRGDRINEYSEDNRWRLNNLCLAVVLLVCHAGFALDSDAATSKPATGMPPKIITAWTHEDSSSMEFDVLKKAAERFNRLQHEYKVDLMSTSSLRTNYESWVQREAANGTLPCLLDFDGPLLPAFAWPQYLLSIDQFVTPELLRDFLPTIVAQGTYQGRIYSLGQFDSGVGLWGNRHYLRAAGVRIPTLDAPWSLAEFEDALAKLTALDDVDYAISFNLFNNGDGNEFYAYAYAPLLQGFGGDLIDRQSYATAKGVLDGPQSVAAMKHFQRWIEKGWTRAVFDRQDDFEKGKTALSRMGQWG